MVQDDDVMMPVQSCYAEALLEQQKPWYTFEVPGDFTVGERPEKHQNTLAFLVMNDVCIIKCIIKTKH